MNFELQHVRFVGLKDASDLDFFQFARLENFSIVTFDSDYSDLSTMKGFPPRIIWIRTGNLTTKSIIKVLNQNEDQILGFLKNGNSGVLEILKIN